MNIFRLLVFVAFAGLLLSSVQTQADFHLTAGETCIEVQDPGTCMESYGFKCHRLSLPSRSIEAHGLGCNLSLAAGRRHFVQMIYDNGRWSVERQRTSTPEPEELENAAENSDVALSDYIRSEMSNYRVYGDGSVSLAQVAADLHFQTGTWRNGDEVTLRAVCGTVFDSQPDENESTAINHGCRKTLLDSIRRLSQLNTTSPFPAAGANEIDWKNTTIALVSNDVAVVSDGRYTFAPKHLPCRHVSGCCSSDGSLYLDSCRVPTEVELRAARSCLDQKLLFRSEAYFDCLREAQVKVGCDEQADGSRMCY